MDVSRAERYRGPWGVNACLKRLLADARRSHAALFLTPAGKRQAAGRPSVADAFARLGVLPNPIRVSDMAARL